jgi:hypothetical protein
MDDPTSESLIAGVMAVARVRAIRTALLPLHKALLDAERARYERAHGRVENPNQALRLVISDPWFAWLRPLADLIVQIDERLADANTPIRSDEVDTFVAQVRALLHGETGDASFQEGYRRWLQDAPEVVMAHARLTAVLAGHDGN